MTTLTINNEFNGIEIKFDSKPITETLDSLKEKGFRWHRQKKLWYAKNTEERLAFAEALADQKEATAEKQEKELNILGVKVGDLFYTSWGYEQTNINFFQVIALKGKSSCLLREVHPELIENEMVSHGMAADRKYKVTNQILPPVTNASFISDNENGDLKRIKDHGEPCINVGRPGHYQTIAYKYNGEALYESWYA